MGNQRLAFVKPVVENSGPDPDHSLWRPCAGRRSRREIKLAAGVVLNFVSQAVAESKIRFVTPVILNIRLDIELADGGQRIPGIDAELGGAPTGGANLRRRHARLHQLQSFLIALDAGKATRQTAGEDPLTGKVVWINVRGVNAPHAAAKLDRVGAFLNLGKVLQLPSIRVRHLVSYLRAATTECATHREHRRGVVAQAL